VKTEDCSLPFKNINPGKILLIKPSALGDIVHALPVLYSIKSSFPSAEIHWVVAAGFQEFLQDHPLITRIWPINKNLWKRFNRIFHTIEEFRTLSQLWVQESFDLVIDLQGLFRSGLMAWLSGAPVRIGFHEAREGGSLFYTHSVKGGRDIHAVTRYLKIAACLGADTSQVTFPLAPLPSSLPSSLSIDRPYAVIAPAAAGEAKRWPAERFGELARHLPLNSVVVSSGADAKIAQTVVEASRGKAFCFAGKTSIKELATIIRGAKFVVCNDSGPMHIAAALNVPVFAIFGPTSPIRTGPYGEIHTVIRGTLPCSPCFRRVKCKGWECLPAISVEHVLQQILSSELL
jgi:lipopolysaccharide heptosyltransferase I